MRSGLEYPIGLESLLVTNADWSQDLDLYPRLMHSRLIDGRGIGRGRGYGAWIEVRDVPSMGTSAHIYGVRTGRKHHLLSTPERIYFRLLERKRNVVDVLDCWPILDLAGTIRLAQKFGVRHPYRDGYPDPVTIDFLVKTIGPDGRVTAVARAIKTKEDAAKEDVQKSLAVQHAWCQSKGIPWALVDCSSFTETMLESLKFLRSWFRVGQRKPDEIVARRFAESFMESYERNVLLEELLSKLQRRRRIHRSQARQLFWYAAWTGDIPVDVQCPIQFNYPLILLADGA